MVVMAEKLKNTMEEQGVHTMEVLVSRRDLNDSPN